MKGKGYDPVLYWKRRIYPAIERFMEVVFPEYDFTTLKISDRVTKQKTLGGF